MSRAFGRENQRARIQVLEVQPKTKKDHLLVRVWRIRPEVFEEACRIRPCDFDDEDDTK
jgi:hypothetical protein